MKLTHTRHSVFTNDKALIRKWADTCIIKCEYTSENAVKANQLEELAKYIVDNNFVYSYSFAILLNCDIIYMNGSLNFDIINDIIQKYDNANIDESDIDADVKFASEYRLNYYLSTGYQMTCPIN